MAGMAGYDQVYRGRSLDHRQFEDDPDKYYNRGMLRPLPLEQSLPLLSEDLSADNGKVITRFFFFILISIFHLLLLSRNLSIHFINCITNNY